MIFGAIVNGVGFEISFSYWSLPGYRNTIHFCLLNVYPVTLLHLLVLPAYIFCGFEIAFVSNHAVF